MTEVRLDPRQAPAGAELLLASDFGRQTPRGARSTAGSRARTTAPATSRASTA